ncbi:hypothetical protein GIY56_16340 [Paracoccus sp. YIM 132242]|uniref:Uncharacterized protein n=2 Tax=Paracoccus lichenicola TaxID=2665644 RepID=A0A6L6HU76_9RHOB|nr:hypothetical protein [Paracoccus lichenicola]
MAEMGYRGLSEQWLMRRAGDLHWRLIAQAIGQREAVFACADGQPLYAAFCVTSLRIESPALPRLGQRLQLSARLWRIGRSRLGSVQTIHVQGRTVGCIRLVSSFVGRGRPGCNRSIVRRAPRAMALPPEAPADLAALAQRGARLAAAPDKPGMTDRQETVLPCPATDFNAAGLLYFPSFAALTDRVDFASGGGPDRMILARDVVYFGNAQPGEALTIGFRDRPCGHLALVAGPGDRPLACLRSRFAVPDRGDDPVTG